MDQKSLALKFQILLLCCLFTATDYRTAEFAKMVEFCPSNMGKGEAVNLGHFVKSTEFEL